MKTVWAASLVFLLTGCPPSDRKGAPASSSSPCTKVGQTCEVTQGKLGSCVQRDDCPDGGACFVCQSQH